MRTGAADLNGRTTLARAAMTVARLDRPEKQRRMTRRPSPLFAGAIRRTAAALALVATLAAPTGPGAWALEPVPVCVVYGGSWSGWATGGPDDLVMVIQSDEPASATCAIDRDHCIITRLGEVQVEVVSSPAGLTLKAVFVGPGVVAGTCPAEGEAPPPATEVAIDVKPGDDTNSINVRSQGVIPVAVLTTDAFDAADVDGTTACFGDADDPSQADCSELKGAGSLEDVDGDGDLDLMMHFQTAEAGIDEGDQQACLKAVTSDGRLIEGCDAITTVE